MFLRRKKFLVFLAVIGIAWIAITTLLGRSSHSEVQTQRNRQKSGSRLRQPEFYYDSEDEVIELEAAKTWAKVKASTQWIGNKWSTAPSIVNRHGQEEHELRHDEQELEEILEDNGIPEIKKWPVAQMHQSEFGSDLVQGQTTRVVKWAGLHWTPATDLKDHNAPDPPGEN